MLNWLYNALLLAKIIMIIQSRIHQNVYLKPILICFFINFISACICFELESFLPFLLIFVLTASFTIVIVYLTIKNSDELIVDNNQIIYKNDYNGDEQIFQMTDIINLKIGKTTSTKPPIIRGLKNSYSVIVRTKIFFILTFRDNKTLKIEHDQFLNFTEFKDYFKQYCLKNGIK